LDSRSGKLIHGATEDQLKLWLKGILRATTAAELFES
jgi:hypothetical protein